MRRNFVVGVIIIKEIISMKLLVFSRWRLQQFLWAHLVCIDACIYALARSSEVTKVFLRDLCGKPNFLKSVFIPLRSRGWNLRFSFSLLLSLQRKLLEVFAPNLQSLALSLNVELFLHEGFALFAPFDIFGNGVLPFL